MKTKYSSSTSVWEKAIPNLLLHCQTIQFLPVCLCNPFSMLPQCGSSEGLSLNPCASPLRGTAWFSSSLCVTQLWSPLILKPAVRETSIPRSQPWTRGLVWGCDHLFLTRGFHGIDIPPDQKHATCGFWTSRICTSALPVSMCCLHYFSSCRDFIQQAFRWS